MYGRVFWNQDEVIRLQEWWTMYGEQHVFPYEEFAAHVGEVLSDSRAKGPHRFASPPIIHQDGSGYTVNLSGVVVPANQRDDVSPAESVSDVIENVMEPSSVSSEQEFDDEQPGSE